MDGQHGEPSLGPDDFRLDLTRPPEPVGGQLPYESTVTAPTEWTPYVYSDAEVRTITGRRRLSISAFVCGVLGLLLAIFGVWGVTLSLGAVVLALVARGSERRARAFWLGGLLCGVAGCVIAVGWIVYIARALLPG